MGLLFVGEGTVLLLLVELLHVVDLIFIVIVLLLLLLLEECLGLDLGRVLVYLLLLVLVLLVHYFVVVKDGQLYRLGFCILLYR